MTDKAADPEGNHSSMCSLKEKNRNNHNIVLFICSKIWQTLTAGTQPSLTMVMVPAERVR